MWKRFCSGWGWGCSRDFPRIFQNFENGASLPAGSVVGGSFFFGPEDLGSAVCSHLFLLRRERDHLQRVSVDMETVEAIPGNLDLLSTLWALEPALPVHVFGETADADGVAAGQQLGPLGPTLFVRLQTHTLQVTKGSSGAAMRIQLSMDTDDVFRKRPQG